MAARASRPAISGRNTARYPNDSPRRARSAKSDHGNGSRRANAVPTSCRLRVTAGIVACRGTDRLHHRGRRAARGRAPASRRSPARDGGPVPPAPAPRWEQGPSHPVGAAQRARGRALDHDPRIQLPRGDGFGRDARRRSRRVARRARRHRRGAGNRARRSHGGVRLVVRGERGAARGHRRPPCRGHVVVRPAPCAPTTSRCPTSRPPTCFAVWDRPALLLAGEEDIFCPAADLRSFAEGFASAHVELIGGTDHFLWRHERAAAAIVGDFLARALRG